MAIRWTGEEVALLREAAPSHTVTELSVMFGRKPTAIYQIGYKLNLTFKQAPRGPRREGADSEPVSALAMVGATPVSASGRPWTTADDAELTKVAGELTIPELADRFQRTVKAVRWRCEKLKLTTLDGRSTKQAKKRAR